VGREAWKYLRFIVDAYDRLPAYCIFLQGDPLFHQKKIIERINNLEFAGFSFFDFGTMKDFYSDQHEHCRLALELATRILGGTPQTLRWGFGALFSVTRRRLLTRPRGYYENLLSLAETSEPFPWQAERLWSTLL
jgi:hypothetical protein